jgi:hypothetical protein
MEIPNYPGWPKSDEESVAEWAEPGEPIEEPEKLSNEKKEKAKREALKYVSKALDDAYKLYTDEAINKLAKQVIGEDFWEGVRIATKLRRGKIEGLPALTDCLARLVGSYTPVNITASMLHARREEEHAKAFLEAKDSGYTDGTADQFARVRVGKLRLQEKAFEGLAESLNEMIQCTKRLQDAEIAEMQHLGKQQY